MNSEINQTNSLTWITLLGYVVLCGLMWFSR